MTKPTLLVLAAGMGSRFGGDKQINGVGPNGEFILDYSLYDAWRAGFGDAVIIIRPALETPLREHFGTRWDGKLAIRYVIQDIDDLPTGYTRPEGRQKPWGTGHAIWCARNAISAPFAAINADDYYGVATFQLLADFLRSDECSPTAYAMVGFELNNTLSENGTVARGICECDSNGYLKSVVENTSIGVDQDGVLRGEADGIARRPLTGSEIASMNFWGFTPSLFGHLDTQLREFLDAHGTELKSEFYIPFVVDRLIHEGKARVKVLSTPEKWFGMTYLADRPVVAEHLAELTRKGIYA